MIDDELEMAKLLRDVNCKHILHAYTCEVIETEMARTIIVIMEAIEGSFRQIANKRAQEQVGMLESELKEIFAGVSQGLIALHNFDITLRDLNEKQIFLTADKRVVLGGFRGFISKKESVNTKSFAYYGPPECYSNSKTAYNRKKGDAWFVGALIVRLLGVDIPFDKQYAGRALSEIIHETQMRK